MRLRGDRAIVLGESGYQRADLDSLLSHCGDAARALFSCPSFDEIHVGYADRSSMASSEAERAICPAKNGMFRPIVIKDGRVIAVQDPRKGYAFLDSVRDDYDQALLEDVYKRQPMARSSFNLTSLTRTSDRLLTWVFRCLVSVALLRLRR